MLFQVFSLRRTEHTERMGEIMWPHFSNNNRGSGPLRNKTQQCYYPQNSCHIALLPEKCVAIITFMSDMV